MRAWLEYLGRGPKPHYLRVHRGVERKGFIRALQKASNKSGDYIQGRTTDVGLRPRAVTRQPYHSWCIPNLCRQLHVLQVEEHGRVDRHTGLAESRYREEQGGNHDRWWPECLAGDVMEKAAFACALSREYVGKLKQFLPEAGRDISNRWMQQLVTPQASTARVSWQRAEI